MEACIRCNTDLTPDENTAWAYRSGLVLITTGYFHHVISNDDELAAVLGHEVAHVISQHALESETIRLADMFFTKSFALLTPLMAIHPIFIFCAVPVMLSTLKSLSLSRTREREADYIGLLLMADAGFDPRGAVSLWTKFNKWEKELLSVAKKGTRQEPQFNSTHPHVSLVHLFCDFSSPCIVAPEDLASTCPTLECISSLVVKR